MGVHDGLYSANMMLLRAYSPLLISDHHPCATRIAGIARGAFELWLSLFYSGLVPQMLVLRLAMFLSHCCFYSLPYMLLTLTTVLAQGQVPQWRVCNTSFF